MTTRTTTQDTLDILDAIVTDWRPSRRDSREALRVAVMRTAGEHAGLVHIADVRPLLPSWVNPPTVGSYLSALVRRGFLLPTGRYRPSGGVESGNGSKPSEVRRLVKPIPPDSLT